jgi:hypothetical protein
MTDNELLLIKAIESLCFNIDTEIASDPLLKAYNQAQELIKKLEDD